MSSASLIARARLFEWYAKHAWPFHRAFVKGRLSRRCVLCAVSEAYSPLDREGICAECRTQRSEPKPPAGVSEALSRELDRLLREHEGLGAGSYDALVMVSGGKDSAFLVHELKRRHPALRLLALTVDNSFMSPVALDNLRLTIERLDVDHLTLRPAASLYRKAFRLACTLAEPGKGCFETVDRADAEIGFSLAKIYAASQRIPLLVSGLSWAQVERIFGIRSYEIPAAIALAKIETLLGRPLEEVFAPAERRYFWNPDRFAATDFPRFIHPFYVWRHEEGEIQRRVVELGLIKRGNDSPLLTNNTIIPMMIVADFLRLGYASFEPEFASQVRAGKAESRFWRNVFEMLEYAAKTGFMLDREIDKIAAELGVTRAEVGLMRG